MSHGTRQPPFRSLAERLNRFPQGAPPSDLLYRILALLFTQREADLVARLPLRPFTAARAGRAWSMPAFPARLILEQLAERGLLLDLERDDRTYYFLPPPMAGFFEFSLMRVRSDLDQKQLSELFFQYLNVEDRFIRELFLGGETQMGRFLVNEPAAMTAQGLAILDHERASAILRNASHRAVGLCYCRHKMAHLERTCDAPLGICMTLNDAAASLIRHGHARPVDPVEGIDLLQEAWGRNLVHCADNVREGVNFICHCCRCCCEGLIAVRRLARPEPIITTGFIPRFYPAACIGCGRCAATCPVGSVTLAPAPVAGDPARKRALPDETTCIGCALCVKVCPSGAIRLDRRPQQLITPVNTAHRVVLMAIERGTLADLIFDSHAHRSHRIMAAILGAILRLPPMQKLLAGRQLKSVYLERLLAGKDVTALSW